MRRRRPAWFEFCRANIPDALARPDVLGHRAAGDPRRVEFARLISPQARWLLVSVKFLDDRAEAWVSSALPASSRYLTRRMRAGTMHKVCGP